MDPIDPWTGDGLCHLQELVNLPNERFAARVRVSTRTIANWRKQKRQILPRLAQRSLTELLDELPEPLQQKFRQAVQRGVPTPETTVSDLVTVASEDALLDVQRYSLDSASEVLETLSEDSAAIARGSRRTARQAFRAAQSVADQARQLIEKTHRPSLLSDLYVVVGQTNALMASSAFDLGHWDAADHIARAAAIYASMAGHSSLEAWVLGLQASMANWREEPDTALALLRKAQTIAPSGEPSVRVKYIAARSYALVGDIYGIQDTLQSAQDDVDRASSNKDPLSHYTGGEFAFGAARAAACAAAAWLDVGEGTQVVHQANAALEEMQALPAGRQSLSQISGTRIDLAAGRLLSRDRDGALEALRPVLSVPTSARNISLTGRLTRVKDILQSELWRSDAEAQEVADEVQDWLTTSSVGN
ncbi:hypothetical protein [Stackebrandtia nassauensis]|uniref:Uncharacterized protein n=1 Tax=Stackebrandtia nassauensis (strain DSM 44728 / CIP 108903 / NRRL B-16338 / NBRC 102104 / LLR-40K-21) TaxID=446470 RepID=D3Q2W4_STANL|nr:hypothetical protein [Stackebrandtia nassauensis]ADD45865.1 hypothetical protein Snas_6244 [Stackebrandtia nassauensis DSM 44728]